MNIDKTTVAHEVGHAVVAYNLDIPFTRISVLPNEDSEGRIRVEYTELLEPDPEDLRQSILHRAAVHHAGWISEMLYGGSSASCLHGASTDLEKVYEDLKHLPESDWANIQVEAQALATNILLEESAFYHHLKEALLQERVLDADGIEAVVGSFLVKIGVFERDAA